MYPTIKAIMLETQAETRRMHKEWQKKKHTFAEVGDKEDAEEELSTTQQSHAWLLSRQHLFVSLEADDGVKEPGFTPASTLVMGERWLPLL